MAKTAIITGATRGIGKGIFRELAKQGINIATVFRDDEESAEAFRESARSFGINYHIEKLDVCDFNQIRQFINIVHEEFGSVDYLINNVGVDVFKTIEDVTLEEWLYSQNVILNAPFCFAKYVLPFMRKQKFGRIINIGASAKDYLKGAAGLGPFGVHKAALTVLTKTLALEEIQHGITVNMVAPGSTKGAGTNPEEKRIAVSEIPIGRRIEIDEVVAAVLYFLSDQAASVTGQFIGVNGGMST